MTRARARAARPTSARAPVSREARRSFQKFPGRSSRLSCSIPPRGMVASPPLVISRRTLYTVRTTAWITGGWVAAAVLVHWVVRRVPTHLARELTAVATGAAIGLGSAWFELWLVPRLVRGLPMGRLLLVRTFFYVALCAV